MTNILDQCQACGEQGKVLRCSKCKVARYCSVECQKSDWKAGHRKTCCLSTNKDVRAHQALAELYGMTQGISVPEAKQRQDQANDRVETQMKMDLLNKKTTIRFSRQDEETDMKNKSTTNLDQSKQHSKASITSGSKPTFTKIKNVSFFLEEMKYIHQFQVSLRPKHPLGKEAYQMMIEPTPNGYSKVNFQSNNDNMEFSITLPRHVLPDQCSWNSSAEDGVTTIQLRLPFQESLTDPELVPMETLIPVETINNIQCGQCHQDLIPTKSMERTYFLPKGSWEEIADYLSCFEGQPVIDFSSSTEVQPSTAAQDANAVCFHASDLGTTVCVLAVSGYGESSTSSDLISSLPGDGSAVVRGNRLWQDTTGGATVCCTQCCSVLGFASLESPETFRLLKHRLRIGQATSLSDSSDSSLGSCASFLAREMVRYAESKAIFTFVIGVDHGESSIADKKCLLLRLVSWDTTIATEATNDDGLKFQKVAKVVYEEALDEAGNDNQSDDPRQWLWGGVDLCCVLPGVHETAEHADHPKVSTVRLALPAEEYETVQKELQAKSNLFPKSIKEATILMKMGAKGITNKMDLTVIPLN